VSGSCRRCEQAGAKRCRDALGRELVRTVCVPELPVGPGAARPQLAVVRRHRQMVVAARHFSHSHMHIFSVFFSEKKQKAKNLCFLDKGG
jgi:hypothetical protein